MISDFFPSDCSSKRGGRETVKVNSEHWQRDRFDIEYTNSVGCQIMRKVLVNIFPRFPLTAGMWCCCRKKEEGFTNSTKPSSKRADSAPFFMMQHNLRLLIAEYDRESNDEPLCNIQNVLQLQGCNYNVKVATKTKHETSPPSFHFTHKSLFEGCYCYREARGK